MTLRNALKTCIPSAIVISLMPCAAADAGVFATMTIDGDFSDWAGVAVVDVDPADNPGYVDIATTQIANDDDFLYIRQTFHGAPTLNTFTSLDVDDNTATGFDVFGLGLIGSEASWQNDFAFTQRTGVFNDGMGMSGDFFGAGHALLAPFGDFGSRELAISRDAVFNRTSTPVFPDDTVTLLFWTDSGAGDVSAPVTYALAVPEPATLNLLAFGGLIALRRRRACRRS